MRFEETEAQARLVTHYHGVLSTVHQERGVDAVPVVYAIEDGYVGIPIDLVKPKASLRLQRERNLASDPRATLLIEHWDREDWSQLWWVRAELHWEADVDAELTTRLAELLAKRYRQYRSQPFARILALRIMNVSGWNGKQD